MVKKILVETPQQKVASSLVLPIFAGALYATPEDFRRHCDQGLPIEQPHDHHERAPMEEGRSTVTVDAGSGTASVNIFSSEFFEGWQNGKVEWPVMLRPDLYITVRGRRK
jgi:hypothetical protein